MIFRKRSGMKINFFLLLLMLSAFSYRAFTQCPTGGAVFINELYNSGITEYYELVVVGDPSNPTAPVNLEGWIVDDNNIDQAGQGTAAGHLILDNQFSSVNPGAIILIYNESSPYGGIPASSPPWLYVVMAADIDGCSSSPSFTNSNYTPCGTSGGSWGYVVFATAGDIVQTRNSSTSFYHGLRYNSVNVAPDVIPLDVSDIIGLDCGDWFDASNYTITTPTPGAPNSPANQLLINAIRYGTLNCSDIDLACDPPCPIIDDLTIDASPVCSNEQINLIATGLANMSQTLNTETNYGINFVIHSGATPPPDPYIGGTSLGIVPFSGLTGSHPNQVATLNNVNISSFASGNYTICAILSPTPSDPNCKVSQCEQLIILPSPSASLSGVLDFCPGDCHEINTQITGGTQPYQASFTFQLGAVSFPFTIPGYDVNNQLNICYSGSNPLPSYNAGNNTLTIPSWITGTGSITLTNVVSADGCIATVINPDNTTLNFKAKNTITNAGPLVVCDNDFDGQAIFDLTTLNSTLFGGQSNVTANWFEDANCTSIISNPTSYTISSTTVYVYISDNNDEKCNSDTIPVQLIVVDIPNPGQDNEISICNTENCVNLFFYLGADTEIGGIWSDDDASGVDLDFPNCVSFIGINSGTYTFTYTTQDINNLCPPLTSHIIVNVGELGNPGQDNQDVFCGAPSNPVNLESYLLNNFDPGGIWTTSGPFNVNNPTSVNMSGANVGTYYFYYTLIDPLCGNAFSTITIQIVDQPNPGSNNNLTVCNIGQNTIVDLEAALGAHDTNGNWNDISGSGVNLSDPENVDFTGILPGAYNFTYTIPQNGTCPSAEAIITVIVGFGANAGNDGNVFVCEGSSEFVDLFDYLGFTYDLGGTWTQLSGTNVSLSDPHNITFNNKPPGSYNFQYSVSSGCGTDIAIVTVVINPAIGAGDGYLLTICQNEIVNLYDSLKNYLLGGYWIDENNNPIIDPLHVTLNQSKTYTFKYIYIGSGPCPNDTSISIITTIPGVNAGNDGSLLICSGAQGSVNLFSYIGPNYTSGGIWWNINNSIQTPATPNINFSTYPVGLDTFMYLVSGSCGKDTSYVFVNITTSPSAGDPYNILVCQNKTVNLFDSLKNYTAGGIWYYEDNSQVFNPKAVKLTDIKQYRFKYIIPASGTCLPDTVVVSITTNPGPYAGIGIDFNVCEKNTNKINLLNYLSGSYTTGGVWKLNNSIIPDATSFNYSSLASGNYTIRYIVASTGICPGDTAEIKLNVLKKPNPGNDVSINICEFAQTNILNFENLIGTHDSGGNWINNYSSIINISNPNNINFKTAPEGIYVFYYVIDPNNVCGIDSSEVKVTVLSKSFAGTDKTVTYCEGTNIKLNLKNELAPDNNIPYLFKDSNNTGILNTSNGEINISSLKGGIYKFQLITGIGDFCGTDTSTLEVKIIDQMFAGTNNSLTVCNDDTNVNLDQLLGIHDAGGSWIDLDNSGVQVQASAGKNVSFVNIPKGKYRYQYHHQANSPCPESNAIITVIVNPVSKFTLSKQICSGENITINGHTYNLANPAGTEIIPNAFGCDSIITIDLKQKQVSSTVSNIDENCFGVGKFTINNLSGFSFPSTLTIVGKGNYQINSVPFEVSNLSSGVYIYSINDPNGCSELNKTFEIKKFVPFSINTDVQQLDDSYLLSVTSNIDPKTISWKPESGLSCSDCLITYAKPLNDQQYIIEITNKEGCVVRDTVFLNRIVDIKLEIPNIFSPDNDGRNDRFFVKCKDCSGKYNLAIFDRWGEKIFSRENMDFNDNTSGWDGKFKNKYLNPGVFVYLIETKLDNGESNFYSGDVLLIK